MTASENPTLKPDNLRLSLDSHFSTGNKNFHGKTNVLTPMFCLAQVHSTVPKTHIVQIRMNVQLQSNVVTHLAIDQSNRQR